MNNGCGALIALAFLAGAAGMSLAAFRAPCAAASEREG